MRNPLHRYTALTLDRQALALAVLLVGTAAGAAIVAPAFAADPSPAAERLASESTATQAAGGAAWAVAEAVVAGLLVVLILAWRKLPAAVRRALAQAGYAAGLLYVGAWALTQGGFWAVLAVVAGARAVAVLAHAFDVWWVVNDALALVIAVFVGAAAGAVLPVALLAAGLVGLAVYDHVFANERAWMFTLGEALVRRKLPVLVVWPAGWRLDWDELADSLSPDTLEDEAENLTDDAPFAIGMADLALPAVFAAAVTVGASTVTLAGWSLVTWGVLAGVAVAAGRLRWVMTERGSGAGLPAIAAGCLGGYGVAAAVAWAVVAV